MEVRFLTAVMESEQVRRVTVRLKKPNPLFEKWLADWRDRAKEKDSKMQYCFSNALQSLRKYPLPLNTGKDCKILQGFGDKLCSMLDQKLSQHKFEGGKLSRVSGDGESTKSHCAESTIAKTKHIDVENGRIEENPMGEVICVMELHTADIGVEEVANNGEMTKNKTMLKIGTHRIGYRSAEFAILITFYETYLSSDNNDFMTKSEIIKKAQCLCDKSFTKADIETSKTAWAGMSTLIKDKLIIKEGKLPKFSLTEKGLSVAGELQEMSNHDVQSTTKSGSGSDDSCSLQKQTENFSKLVITNDTASSPSLTNGARNEAEPLIIQRHSCDVILLVDVQETNG